MEPFSLKPGGALLWVLGYVGLLLICALLDVALWRKLFPGGAAALNLIATACASLGYLALLSRAGWRPRLLGPGGLRATDILLTLACAGLFYLLLDKGLDPLLDRCFPQSQQGYQESVAALKAHPAAGLVRVCLIAPVMEEVLTRGLLLEGLREYGLPLALTVSVGVFALLHFNLVQTLSAVVCGVVLGLLYLHTGSLLCCVLAHAAYNLISYLTLLRQ